MSVEDFKFLWIRDGAGTMIKPSISRNDHDKDYTLDNCSYMEFSDHLSMDKSNIY